MDTIANMINGIKNAGISGRQSVELPYSKVLAAIASVLHKEGYLEGFSKKMKQEKPYLSIDIKYTREGKPRIAGVKRVSKSSRRVYLRSKDIKDVKFGYGMLVMTTPKGILSGKDAKKELVGGEALFEIW